MSTAIFKRGAASRMCAVLALNLIGISASYACRTPPSQQLVTPEQQIAMATDVSVARVVKATPSPLPANGRRSSVEYEFEVLERIAGAADPRFTLVGATGQTRTGPDSSDHSDEEFWERGGGRLHNDSDCMLRPDFTLGETYLVFRGSPPTWRSFKHIASVGGKPHPDDRWLAYVKAKLTEAQK
ncbi:hypothetical protein MasN3_02560 [Massilia varians]|uniref:Lipoprotein n=1 Tax=Massilia varians TaxID=457921 RepID=A0ABN6T3Z4_9BURK|nr:hypothetical protein [Massilia varians]BDT56762.1 hypothetical protein MasN3_02560 [Massilia varians]